MIKSNKTLHRGPPPGLSWRAPALKKQLKKKKRKGEVGTFGTVSEFNATVKSPRKRCGIIYYTFVDGELFFCMGVDKNTGEFSDFGGGLETGETSVECSIREGYEESKGVFGELTPSMMDKFFCIWGPISLVIFVNTTLPEGVSGDIRTRTEQSFNSAARLTTKQKATRHFNEMKSIVWMNRQMFTSILTERKSKVYPRIKNLLSSCTSFMDSMRSSLTVFEKGQPQMWDATTIDIEGTVYIVLQNTKGEIIRLEA